MRVGDTVHRRSGYWTRSVDALLAHLQRVGFDAAPRPLGIDDEGRSILSFVPGEAHLGWPDPMPVWVYEDEETLSSAAQLLRRYHDAVATFIPPPDARWRVVAPGRHEVICHNDWGPYNALFEGHRPVVMLDWDSAGPGPRIWDLAWSAYTSVPLNTKGLGPNGMPIATRAARLATFSETYGGVEPASVLAMLVEALPFLANTIQAEAEAGDPGSVKLANWDAPARARADAAIIREQSELLLRR